MFYINMQCVTLNKLHLHQKNMHTIWFLCWIIGEMLLFGQVGADDREVLDQIIDSLTSLAKPTENHVFLNSDSSKISLKLGKDHESETKKEFDPKNKAAVLILGAGRVCQPAAEMLSSVGKYSSSQWYKISLQDDFEEQTDVEVIVGSLYLKDAEQVL